jgi:aspartate/glutamate racemase
MASAEYLKRISEGAGALPARKGDLITDQDKQVFQIIEVKEATRWGGTIASLITGALILEPNAATTLSIFCKTAHEELVLDQIDAAGVGYFHVQRLEDEHHDTG